MKVGKQCTLCCKSIEVRSFDYVIGSPHETLLRLVDCLEIVSIASQRSQIVLIGHDDDQVRLSEGRKKRKNDREMSSSIAIV